MSSKANNKFQQGLMTGDPKIRKMLERYGVEGYKHGHNGQDERGAKEVMDDLKHAARNDYDTRRTLEAAAMSGKKKAQKIIDDGFSNIGTVMKSQNFMEKAAERRGVKNFSSHTDYMGLTQSMVERDRRKQTEGYEKQFASKDDINGIREDLESQKMAAQYKPGPLEKSDELARAEERLSEAEGNGPVAIYGNNNEPAATDNAPKDATKGFLYDYKEEVKKKFGPMSNQDAELETAARIVSS